MTSPDRSAVTSAPTHRPALAPADLQIVHARALRGPSPWHDAPAILCELRLGTLARATPGRLNLLRVGRGHVVVDYAHNAAAVEALLDFVRRFDARRRVGVIAVPGDRRDEDIRAVGRICAGFDRVVVKEDADRRGRAPGEIVRLLQEGLRSGGLAADAVETAPDEAAAVAHALATMRGGDLVVVLAVDVDAVLAQVRRAASETDGAATTVGAAE